MLLLMRVWRPNFECFWPVAWKMLYFPLRYSRLRPGWIVPGLERELAALE
jgi:hypothetical protein